MRAKRTTYAIAIDEQVGEYPAFPTSAEALRGAYGHIRHEGAQTVTVLRVEHLKDGLRISPLVTVTPPVVPTFSTSPGGIA